LKGGRVLTYANGIDGSAARAFRLCGFESIELNETSLLNGTQDGGGVIDAVVVMEVVVAVKLPNPGIGGIGFANDAGVIPICFRDLIAVAFGIDDREMPAHGIMDVDFGTASKGGNRGHGRKQFPELPIGQ